MGLILTVGIIVIVITCFSIEVKMKKTNEQNMQMIELLKRLVEK